VRTEVLSGAGCVCELLNKTIICAKECTNASCLKCAEDLL
jgi:hypothetical protein